MREDIEIYHRLLMDYFPLEEGRESVNDANVNKD